MQGSRLWRGRRPGSPIRRTVQVGSRPRLRSGLPGAIAVGTMPRVAARHPDPRGTPMKLLSHPFSPYGRKVTIAMAMKGLEDRIEIEAVDTSRPDTPDVD